MKKYFLFLLLHVISVSVFANVTIFGRIIDAITQKPIEFVTVSVYNPQTGKNVAGTLTNQDGAFSIPSVANGDYELRASVVGYNSISKPVKVSGKAVAMGNIPLSEDAKTLKEIEVVGQGSQMRFDIDKKVFSVDQNIAAAGGSATDVLQNIPSVNVDNEGNVSLRNNESVEVWINGKPSGLTAENRAQVLQQMPAESIEAIEVMTNPSAKFKPEGTAGIINLVMKKNRKAGYYGSLSAGSMYTQGSKPGINAGASINYSSSKIDAFANIGHRQMNMTGTGLTDRQNFNNGDTTLLNQFSEDKRSFGGTFFRAGVDYHLNSKNTIGISGFGHSGSPSGTSNISYLLTDKSTAATLRNYTRDNSEVNSHGGYNLNLNHKYDLDTKGSNIITNLSYSGHSRNGDDQFVQTDKLNTLNKLDINQTADNSNKELEAKTDFTKKIGENTRLELGWNSTWQNRISLADGYDNINKSEILSYYNKFTYQEQIHAAYATYGTRISNLSLQAGLRAEYLQKQLTSTSKNLITSISETNKLDPQSYLELFPSVYMAYSLPKNNELQLNYTRRVNRPRGRQINSFRDYSDATTISYGNPALLPEFASAFELNYVKNWDNHTLSASAYYRFTDDVIQNVRFMRNSIMESTFMNLTKQQNTGLELVSKNRLFKFVNLTTSVNLYHARLNEATYQDPFNAAIKVNIPGNSNFSWDTRVLANLMFSRTFSGQITGMYSAPQIIAQGKRAQDYSVDLGLRKTFMDKKINLNLMVRDLLNSRKMSATSWGDGFYQVSENRFSGRMIGLTVTYNFGNMKPKPADRKNGNSTEPAVEGMDME